MKLRHSGVERRDFVERRAWPRPPRFIARVPTHVKVKVAFAIAFPVLAFVSISVRVAHTQLRDAVAVQVHTHDVLRGVSGLAVRAGTAETAHRRYIASGDETSLQQFETAVRNLQLELDRLDRAFPEGSDAENAQRVRDLRAIVEERVADMQSANELRRAGRIEEAEAVSAELAQSARSSGASALLLTVGSRELATLGVAPVEIEQRVARLSRINQAATLFSALLLLIAMWVIMQDLRERRRIEKALRDSEAWLRGYEDIFDASPDGVIVIDSDTIVRDVNAAAATMFGYGSAELVGQPVELLIGSESREAYERLKEEFLSPDGKPSAALEMHGQHKGGGNILVEISLSTLTRDGDSSLVIATVRNMTQRRRLREFSASALRASEEERQRIARELHDDTAQRLASALIRLRLLAQAGKNGTDQQVHIKALHEELSETAESVLQLARGLRPPGIERSNLDSILRTHVRRIEESTGFMVELDVEPVDELLTPDQKLVVYRILQESLTNAMRHANVSSAKIAVRRRNGRVIASLEDQGRGFDVSAAEEREVGGLGLLGMRERAAMVGGELLVESRPNAGTRVEVHLPVQRRAAS